MGGLPIELLKEYGVVIFLVGCVCVFLWYLIRVMGDLVKNYTKQISDERERWETIVDNHLSELGKNQQSVSSSLSQTLASLTTLNTVQSKHDEQCSKNDNEVSKNLTECTRIIQSIDKAHRDHDERQTTDHGQSATEHAVIMERLPKGKNGYRRRKT